MEGEHERGGGTDREPSSASRHPEAAAAAGQVDEGQQHSYQLLDSGESTSFRGEPGEGTGGGAAAPPKSSATSLQDAQVHRDDAERAGMQGGQQNVMKNRNTVMAAKSDDSAETLQSLLHRNSTSIHEPKEKESAGAGTGDGRENHQSMVVEVAHPSRVEDITPELIREMETQYAAYTRHDIYGTRGKGPLSLKNKLSLCVALVTIVPVRLIVVAFLMLMYFNYFVICKICTLFRKEGEEEGQENYGHLTGVRKKVITVLGRWLARAMLFAIGFYRIKKVQGNSSIMRRLQVGIGEDVENDLVPVAHPCAIVSNHVSYLDILYHMSSSFPSFVAKKSVSQMPFIGLISKCMGCVYVQREAKTPTSKGISSLITSRLQATLASKTAQIFLLFPEGTTTNGDYLLPFKTGAFLAGVPVLPMILKYPHRRFNPAWDTINGYLHVILLLCQFTNRLEVTTLPAYYPSAKERADPKIYAQNVRNLMSLEGHLTPVDIGLFEKRVYHASLAGKIFTRSESSLQ